MIFQILFLVVLTSLNSFAISHRIERKNMIDQIRPLIKSDPNILKYKSDPIMDKMFLGHPSYIEHNGYQSVRYHEDYKTTVNGKVQEWEVYGAGVDFHFYVDSTNLSKTSVDYSLDSWTNAIYFENLLSQESIAKLISQNLSFSEILSPDDLNFDRKFHKKLLINDNIATPTYWNDISEYTLEDYSESEDSSPRILVINAITGEFIFNYKINETLKNEIPPVLIRNGLSPKPIYVNKSENDADQNKLKVKFKNACQVISTHNKSKGEALLVLPDNCEIVANSLTPAKNADESAIRARNNSISILDYFQTVFDQFGFDNDKKNPKPVTSIVHIGDKYENAYWDPELEIMAYGDGSNGHDFTLALDIAGHEFTHAIVSNTARFMHPGEPGALDEGFADIFGILISRHKNKYEDWNLGGKLYDNKEGDSDEIAMRSLKNPAKYKTFTTIKGKDVEIPFPSKYSEILYKNSSDCNDDNDYCEVHANSTIWSHNAYLIDTAFQKLGYNSKDADLLTGKLFFITLTHRLHENSSMKESAQEVIKVCNEILKESECKVVKEAFTKTELAE